jgi:hypothetical protein
LSRTTSKTASVRCFFDVGTTKHWPALLPLLEEVAVLPDDELLPQEIHNILNLRKENAKLRGLAVKLSNFLGDLPAGEWEDALANAYGPPMR